MRVLILGHNPFNLELPNGRTLYELFSKFNSEDIAEIFLHDDIPNFDICKNYYRMTDFDVVKSFYSFKTIGKRICGSSNGEKAVSYREATGAYHIGSKRQSYMVFLRNIMWQMSRWNSAELNQWIMDFNPDILFFYSGNYSFTIDMALSIAQKYGIPIVTYIVDDYYFNANLRRGFWGRINQGIFNKKLHVLLSSSTTICLNDTMQRAYEKEFNGSFETIYTTSELKPFLTKGRDGQIVMSYLGGIACGRAESIAEIGKIIHDCNLPIQFHVFTRETRPWLIEPLRKAVGIKVYNGLPYKDVITQMEKSDILVHVEGFDKENIELVKYSMSTKIADILSCNRCLLAYGPSEVASISYLLNNQCGLVATDKDILKDLLIEISNGFNYNCKTERGMQIARQNHSVESNDKKLRSILYSVTTKA